MVKRHRYRLKDGLVRIHASDLVLDRGDTVELDDEQAQAINDARPEPVIERAGGTTSEESDDE